MLPICHLFTLNQSESKEVHNLKAKLEYKAKVTTSLTLILNSIWTHLIDIAYACQCEQYLLY